MNLRKKISIGILAFVGIFFVWQYVLAVGYSNNPTFNTNNGTGFNGPIFGAFIQPDGKIFTAGSFTSFNGNSNFHGVGRINADGTYDNTFGSTSGITGSGYGDGNSAGAVLYSSTGKTFVCGNFTHYNNVQKNFIVSINSDGTINNSFNSGSGLANVGCRRIVEDLNNKIIIVGDFISYNGTSVGSIARINLDGTIDNTFNAGGSDFDTYGIYDVEILPDGKYLVSSNHTHTYNGVATGGLIRLNSDGTRDTSFNFGGSGFDGAVGEIVRQSDGKILVGGYFTSYNGTTANRLIRLNEDGTIDNTFLTNIGTGFDNGVNGYGISVQLDGRIVLGGVFTSFNGNAVNRIVRLNANGTYDNTFAVGTGFNDSVNGIILDTDNSLVVFGSFTSFNGISANRIARLQPSDVTAPVIAEVTPITDPTYDQTPDYVLNTDEAGSATFGGACNGTTSRPVVVGNNTITLSLLAQGVYSDCTVTVYDDYVNASNVINIPEFEVIDETDPIITEITAVIQPTMDTTPSYTFNTNEVGTLVYGGTCSSATVSAIQGNNVITFNTLAPGLYNSCTITITDSAGNSSVLNITPFTVSDISTFTITNINFLTLSNYHTIITYNTSYPSETYIDFGEDDTYDWGSYTDSDLKTSHSMLFDNLDPNMTYHFKITAIDQNSTSVESEDMTFTTKSFTGTHIMYSPDNEVYDSIVDSDGNAYFVGYFDEVGVFIDGAGLIFTDLNQLNPNIPKVTNGPIQDMVSDGNGGYYIAGCFDSVDSIKIRGLARVDQNGIVDQTFNPDIDNCVYNLAISNGVLYAIGSFSQIYSTSTPVNRQNAAAFQISDGSLLPWDPSIGSVNDYAKIVIHDNKAYVSGNFTSVNTSTISVTRNRLAAFNLTDGTVDGTWNPNLGQSFSGAYVNDIKIIDSKLYAVGYFNRVNQDTVLVTRNNIAAFNLTDGTVDGTWNPDINYEALAIDTDGTRLYVGGYFDTVNQGTTPVSRNYLASFNLTDGAVDLDWDPSVSGPVMDILISNNKLYTGGQFYEVNTNTTPVYYPYSAAFDLDTGLVDNNWNLGLNSSVTGLNMVGSQIFIKGYFDMIFPVERNNAYAVNASGNLLPWKPDLDDAVYSIALSPDEETVYLGGYFETVNQSATPVTRNKIAAFDTITGLVKDFDPDISNDVQSIAVSPDGNTVYVGGDFQNVNSNTTPVSRNYLASFNAETGLVTSFDPDLDGEVGYDYGGGGLRLNSDGSILYVGGDFQNVNSNTTPVSRNGAAAFDTATGLVTNWNPDIEGYVNSIELSLDEETVYLGGYFETANQSTTSVTRNNLAAFDAETGIVTSFDPDVSDEVFTIELSKDGRLLYIGGYFYDINDNTYEVSPEYFTAIRTSDGLADEVAGLMYDYVYTISLAPNGTDLYVGGYFDRILGGDIGSPYVAKFTVTYTDIINPAISETTPVATPTTDTTPSYTFTTSEAGTITYGGSCSSSTTSATIGSNTVTFNTLNSGTYSSCTITVTDSGNNVSNTLTVSTFTINADGGSVAVISLPITPVTQTPVESPKTEEKNTEVVKKEIPKKEIPQIDNDNSEEVVNENIESVDGSNTESNTEEISQTNMMNNSSESNSSNSGGSEATGSGIGSVISSFFTGSVTETFVNITNAVGNTVESVSKSVQIAKTATKEVIETKTGDAVVKTVTAVGFVATATTTAMTAAFLNPISMGEIVMIPMRLWSLLLGFLGIRKKNRPWGTVYDSITKQPLDPAYVSLMDTQTGEEVVSMITDLDGRYGFIVKPGIYNLVASKTNYSFPSKNLSGKESDELYTELYFGTQITITEEGDVINKNIPLDPVNFDWNEFAKRDQNLNVYFKKKDLWLARISKVLFPTGFVIAFIALIVAPQPYNYGIAGLYVLALISKKILFRPKPKVKIKYLNGRPASFSIIRFMTEAGQEVAHKVADINGEVFCLITDGQYKMSVEIKNPDATYTKMIDSQDITVKGGYYSDNIYV